MAKEELIKSWDSISEPNLVGLIAELKKIIKTPAAIILSGPVGAGKTTFTKYFVDKKDAGEILSPTYSIVNETGAVAHADFYRLKDPEEVIHLELNLYLGDKDFFLIEWGKPFAGEIVRNLPENFSLYELVFEVMEKEGSNEPRNIKLSELNSQ